MKTINFLAEHKGELSTSEHDIIKVWQPEHVKLLDKEKSVLINHDFHQLTTIKKFKKIPVQLPEWMNPDAYAANCKRQIDFKYYTALGAAPEWPEIYFNKLREFGTAEKYVCIKLLNTKNFRSTFRESLRDQLRQWLEADENQYPSPFSRKQWECLITKYDRLEADQISARAYRDRKKLVYN